MPSSRISMSSPRLAIFSERTNFTFLGAVTAVSVMWNAADFCNGLMVLPNLLSLWLFAPQISNITQAFFARPEFAGKSSPPRAQRS